MDDRIDLSNAPERFKELEELRAEYDTAADAAQKSLAQWTDAMRGGKGRAPAGNYMSGPITDDGPPTLLGKEVITSPVITEGTAIVGAFAAGATVWVREDSRVTFAETGLGDAAGEELFTRNLVRFRAEERIAFGVERPSGFCQVLSI